MDTLQMLAPYDPGEGTAPPGSGGITLGVDWLAWGVFIICVGALIFIGGKMMMARRRGGDNTGEDLGSWLIGTIIATSASGIIAAILTAAG